MKLGKVFWGLFCIVGAAFIIVSQLGYMQGVGIISLLFTVILAAIAIKSLASLEFFGLFMSIAIIGIIYDEQLGIEALTPWPLLGAALLLSIGFGIFIKPRKKSFSKSDWAGKSEDDRHDDNFTKNVERASGETVYCSANFSSAIKYVDSKNFQRADINCKFGGVKIYFDNAEVDNGFAEINVDTSFGGIEMYIPKNWTIENNVHNFLGGMEEKNRASSDGSVRVRLNGNISFGGITIIYV